MAEPVTAVAAGRTVIAARSSAALPAEPGDESIGSEQMTRTSVRPTLVVVEVKTRSSLRQGPPAAAVDPRKLARLRALTAAWVTTHEAPRAGLRLDVISILLRDARPALLRHHRAVGASWG